MSEKNKTRADFSTDSEWYTYMVTHPDIFKKKDEEDSPKKQEYQKGIFLCEKCGLVIDETANGFEKAFKGRIKRDENGNITNCPNCNASSKYLKKITKERMQEIKRKKKKKEENGKLKQTKIAKENIKDDLLDLLDDLEKRLINNEIDIKRFVVIFMNLSKKIVDRNCKGVDLDIDWLDYRKNMLDACQLVIDSHSLNEDAQKLMLGYEEDINQDKLYLAEFEYYINDDKYSIADYELSERIKEYDNAKQNIFLKEQKQEVEKNFQKRRIELEEKARNREMRRIERAIN